MTIYTVCFTPPIVGVVGSTKNLGLDQPPFPEVFAVHQQVGGGQNQLFC
jgi:hypothetical protein